MKTDFYGLLATGFLTLLIIHDFFPGLNLSVYIPKPILIGLMLLTVLISIFRNGFQKDQFTQDNLKWQIITVGYLFALIIILTLAGGVSQVGLSLTNPFLWIVLVISIFDIVNGYKKVRESQLRSEA